MPARDPARDWPFWAPSQAAAVEEALDLAELGPGDRFIDLGCGDGQVVLAAAERGAHAAGVESDPELAEAARAHLSDAGVPAAITCADLFDDDLDLDADVLFSYLAPATLQRLVPRLTRGRGVRLVTVDFDVPGLVPTRRGSAARLYRLPGRRRRIGASGWPTAGTLVSTVPDVQSLSCLDLVHPGGPVAARLSPPLTSVASVFAGADALDGPGHLAVDIRWEGAAVGTVAGGHLELTGVEDHGLFVVFTDEEEAVWDLDEHGVDGLRRRLHHDPAPRTVAELLDSIEG